MTIVFAGGEMGSFIPSDSTVTEAGTANSYDSAFARCSIVCDKAPSYIECDPAGTLTTAWLHFDLSVRAGGSGSTAHQRMVWLDGSGTERVRITHRYDTDAFTLQYDVGAGWVTAGSSITLDLELPTRQTIDLKVVCNSASGSLTLYVAGTQRISSGTVDLSAITALNKVRFYGASIGSLGSGSYISQVIMADVSTIGRRLMTFYPSGTGATDQWTGSYTSVDETVYSDADFMFSDTADQVEVFSGTAVASITGYTVAAVVVTARAKYDGSGPNDIQLAIRTASTNYFSATQALDAGYGAHVGIWETNPNTTLAWVNADAAAIQFGMKSIT